MQEQVLHDQQSQQQQEQEHIQQHPTRHGRSGTGSSVVGTASSNHASGADDFCALKFLVDTRVAGSIIGKGGSTITGFQEQSGAKIKLSQSRACKWRMEMK